MPWEFLPPPRLPLHAHYNSSFLPSSPSVLVHRRRKTEISHGLESISLPPTSSDSTYKWKTRWITKRAEHRERRLVSGKAAVYKVLWSSQSWQRVLAQTFAYFAVFSPLEKQLLIWESGQAKTRGGWGVFACLCIQLVYVLYNLFVLLFVFTSFSLFVLVYARVCVSVNLMYAPIILRF